MTSPIDLFMTNFRRKKQGQNTKRQPSHQGWCCQFSQVLIFAMVSFFRPATVQTSSLSSSHPLGKISFSLAASSGLKIHFHDMINQNYFLYKAIQCNENVVIQKKLCLPHCMFYMSALLHVL